MEEIEPKDIIAWQNELLSYRDENGELYAPTYLKTIHAQLSAIFNHAVRFYHLTSNPAQKAGSMGSEEHKEMLFWTKEEYLKFADAMMDKPQSYYAFEMLYWLSLIHIFSIFKIRNNFCSDNVALGLPCVFLYTLPFICFIDFKEVAKGHIQFCSLL